MHELNDKSVLLQELQHEEKNPERKEKPMDGRIPRNETSNEGGCPGKGDSEIVDPGANVKITLHQQ